MALIIEECRVHPCHRSSCRAGEIPTLPHCFAHLTPLPSSAVGMCNPFCLCPSTWLKAEPNNTAGILWLLIEMQNKCFAISEATGRVSSSSYPLSAIRFLWSDTCSWPNKQWPWKWRQSWNSCFKCRCIIYTKISIYRPVNLFSTSLHCLPGWLMQLSRKEGWKSIWSQFADANKLS